MMRFKTALRIAVFSAFWAAAAAPVAAYKVLVFWGIGGFALGNAQLLNTAIREIGAAQGFEVDVISDRAIFTAANLAPYRAVVMNNNSELGKLLDTTHRAALMAFLKTRGHVGIHLAAEVMGSWPAYREYLGTESASWSQGTVWLERDTLTPGIAAHPVLRGMPATFRLKDHWYAFKTNPRLSPGIQVLYTLKESNCTACITMPGGDHPVSWVRESAEGGRMFYMAQGHDATAAADPATLRLLSNAILWAARDSAFATGTLPGALSGRHGAKVAVARDGIRVEVSAPGTHALEILRADGKRIFRREGNRLAAYDFPREPGIVFVNVLTTGGTMRRAVPGP